MDVVDEDGEPYVASVEPAQHTPGPWKDCTSWPKCAPCHDTEIRTAFAQRDALVEALEEIAPVLDAQASSRRESPERSLAWAVLANTAHSALVSVREHTT